MSGALIGGSVATTAGASLVRVGPPTGRPPVGARAIGVVPAGERLTVDLVLSPRSSGSLAARLAEPSAKRSSLSPHEFLSLYGPSRATVSAAERWLAAGSLSVRYSGLVLEATGSVAAIEERFSIRLERYRLRNGRIVHAPKEAPSVPSWLASQLAGVSGLSDEQLMRPELTAVRRGPAIVSALPAALPAALSPHLTDPTSCASASSSRMANYTMEQVGSAYGVDSLFSSGWDGTGQRIAVVEFAAYDPAAIQSFANQCGLDATHVHLAYNDPALPAASDPTNGSIEADLDIEELMAQAPGATIDVYEAGQGSSSDSNVAIWQKIVSGDDPFVSTSWGACEEQAFTTDGSSVHSLLVRAAAQGQSIFAAAGDQGSADCYASDGDSALAVDYPASDPNVIAVGGTTLSGSAANGWSETAWNDGNYAGGGGVSCIFAQPSWQGGLDGFRNLSSPSQPCGAAGSFERLTETSQTCTGACRGVPDLSADAGASVAIVDSSSGFPGWDGVVGTSAAAPMLAGVFADVAVGCAGGLPGLSGRLYASAAAQGAYPAAFTDVTSGNNDVVGINGGQFAAGSGYDLATGLGSPVAPGQACPQLSSVSASSGVGGQSVTLSGTNLSHAAVAFGSTSASVVSAASTSITVVVPSGSGAVSVSASSPTGRGTQTVSFTYTASASQASSASSPAPASPSSPATTTSSTSTTTTTTTAPASKSSNTSTALLAPLQPTIRAPKVGHGVAVTTFTLYAKSPRATTWLATLARCASWSTRSCRLRSVTLAGAKRSVTFRKLAAKRFYWIAISGADGSVRGTARLVRFRSR
ncbi:MAG: putative cell wall binding repeat 2-containing protein [Acidimicrobiaceae bacterium]|nr:putative cell wall binding repeat 2-containing protein [Acidimicrobiaceae bacterium]